MDPYTASMQRAGEKLDDVFGALAHPLRRRLLAQLITGQQTVVDLARPHSVSLNAVSKHIKRLESAGIVKRQISGQTHWITLCREPIRDAVGWARTPLSPVGFESEQTETRVGGLIAVADTIEMKVDIARSPQAVFSAWASADALAAWFAPMAVRRPDVTMDFRIGGTYSIAMELPDGSVHTTTGEFQDIVPAARIVMTWHCDAFPDPASLVTVVV